MPFTIAEIKKLSEDGAESVTLTRAEWEALWEVARGYCANALEVGRAQREMERVQRISRPVWVACRVVSGQIRRALAGTYGKLVAGERNTS
jgi:hypothetical protein